MKKFVAMLLVLVLVLCSTAFAEAGMTQITWDEVAERAGELVDAGEFVALDEVAVQLWVPSALAAVELTDEEIEAGFIAYFCTEDESAYISVQYVDVEGASLEDYAATLTEFGIEEYEFAEINGLTALGYTYAEGDSNCIAFATEAGYILEIAVGPMSDEEVAAIAGLVIASVQAVEVEAAA